jgi:hypothetical protein
VCEMKKRFRLHALKNQRWRRQGAKLHNDRLRSKIRNLSVDFYTIDHCAASDFGIYFLIEHPPPDLRGELPFIHPSLLRTLRVKLSVQLQPSMLMAMATAAVAWRHSQHADGYQQGFV